MGGGFNRGGGQQRGGAAPNVAPGGAPSQRNFQAGPRGNNPQPPGGQDPRRFGAQNPSTPGLGNRTMVGRPNFDRQGGSRSDGSNRGNPALGAQPNNPQPRSTFPGGTRLGQPGTRPNTTLPNTQPNIAQPGNRGGRNPASGGIRGPNNPPDLSRDGNRPGSPPSLGNRGGRGEEGRRDANRPNFDRPGDRPGNRPDFVERNRQGGRDGNRDRDNRDRDGNRGGNDRDGNRGNIVDRDRDGRPDGRPDFNRRPGDRDGRGPGRPGDIGSRPFGRNDFVQRNFRNDYWSGNRQGNWNDVWRQNSNWQNRGGDWRRSNWYANYWHGGYRPRYSPWFGVIPGLGWNWGGWGWGWGWPQWGWGYGGWGGYGYGYGQSTVYLQAPATTIVYQPTEQQLQYSQDYFDLAVDAFRGGNYEAALRYCQHAMVDNARNGDVMLLTAQCLMAMGDYARAADAVRMAVETLPPEQWGNVLTSYATYYPDMQQYTDQLRRLEAAARQSRDRPELPFLLGYNYGFLNYAQQAVTQFDRALDVQPQDSAALKLRNRFASQAGMPARQAAAVADTPPALPAPEANDAAPAQASAPPTADQVETATSFVHDGEAAMQRGDYAQAASYFQHALVDTPQNGGAVLLLAQALFAMGQHRDAAGAVQMAMQLLAEEDWGMVVKHFDQLYTDRTAYGKQLQALEAARDKQTDDPALRFLLGYHFGFLGHREPALRELDKAIALEPQDQGSKKLREMFAATEARPIAGAPTPGGQ